MPAQVINKLEELWKTNADATLEDLVTLKSQSFACASHFAHVQCVRLAEK
jgi:hypothetical protein